MPHDDHEYDIIGHAHEWHDHVIAATLIEVELSIISCHKIMLIIIDLLSRPIQWNLTLRSPH